MVSKNKKNLKKHADKRQSVLNKIKLSSNNNDPEQINVPQIDTKPVKSIDDMSTVRISSEVSQIKLLLEQNKFLETYSKALSPDGSPDEIEHLLLTDDEFANLACHNNREIAHYYASDVAGLGAIQILLDKSKLPGHDRITDIGFNSNGFMTVETNRRKFVYGNKKGEPKIDKAVIQDIIGLMTQQNNSEGTSFTKTFPLYNGANKANYLRISATHESVSPYGPTLSIRVSTPYLALTEKNFNESAPKNHKLNVLRLLAILVKCHANIMISAETGAGKTELQKLLIKYIPFEDRIILVEDTDEMHLPELYPKKDIFSWLSGTIKGRNTITDLIIHALRNNPKWLIIAETRGSEAYEMFQGVKSDHSIITTLHATTNDAVPSRFAGMIQTDYSNLDTATLEKDFLDYMDIGIHLVKKTFHGYVVRYIDEIVEYVPISKKYPHGVNILFKQHINEAGIREYYTNAPTAKLQRKLIEERDKALSEKEWPVYSSNKPQKEIINKDLYDEYKKRKAANN